MVIGKFSPELTSKDVTPLKTIKYQKYIHVFCESFNFSKVHQQDMLLQLPVYLITF